MGVTEIATAIIFYYLQKTRKPEVGTLGYYKPLPTGTWDPIIINLRFALELTDEEAYSIFNNFQITKVGDMGVLQTFTK